MKRRNHFYCVEAFYMDSPGYLAIVRVSSRRSASAIFGTLRTRHPEAIVTLNRRERINDSWVSTTHHEK